MLNFKQIVESLLLETVSQHDSKVDAALQDSLTSDNEWVYKLVNLHAQTFPNIPIEQQRIASCLKEGFGNYNSAPKPNIIRSCIPLERLYDAFYTVAKRATQAQRAPVIAEFVKKVSTLGEAEYNNIASNLKQNRGWNLQGDVSRAYDKLMDERDLAAKAALQTYNKQSILNAVNEIIKKRSDAFSRITTLRNPFTSGFTKLIEDVLINPEQYISGNKKVSNDFKTIVDDLYFKNVIQVGLTAKKLYEVIAGTAQINIESYKKMLNNSVNNKDYTIEAIDNMGTEESLALITALKNIAEYTKEKVGRGERLKFAGQAASAITDFAGASLYGGPR